VDPISDGSSRGRLGGASLLSSVSRTTLAALTVGLALGVAAPREARAGPGTVNPSQTFTYVLGTYNPTTFGVGAGIYAASGAGVYGGSGAAWNCRQPGRHPGLRFRGFSKIAG
jgi:F0F1-type ATP synthase membrane subunit c/vacuolar-type H+-ATPase subunit K